MGGQYHHEASPRTAEDNHENPDGRRFCRDVRASQRGRDRRSPPRAAPLPGPSSPSLRAAAGGAGASRAADKVASPRSDRRRCADNPSSVLARTERQARKGRRSGSQRARHLHVERGRSSLHPGVPAAASGFRPPSWPDPVGLPTGSCAAPARTSSCRAERASGAREHGFGGGRGAAAASVCCDHSTGLSARRGAAGGGSKAISSRPRARRLGAQR